MSATKTNVLKKINPNASKAAVFSADLSDEKCYPRLIEGIQFSDFRHINDLSLTFKTPVSVISGANKSGKTTVLLSIACSHFEFKKRDYTNGKSARHTWSDVLKFTLHDIQASDWTYHLSIKTGAKTETRRGQRKATTKKWNGVGKKESQIKGVEVVYVDLDRILPARYYSSTLHKKSQSAIATNVSAKNQIFIEECISYIFQNSYSLQKIANHMGEDVLGFTGENNQYSSYNCASGEDVLSRILIDSIEAPQYSLILIDEIELGLHPGIQRRLMDIIFEISTRDQKQFIITTHSATIISSVPEHARIFIDRKGLNHESISPISINAALSKMDSANYPLIDLFCEDDIAERICHKALQRINSANIPGISSKLINIVVSGSADITYINFQSRKRTFNQVKIKSGHSCVLDGDMRTKRNKDSAPLYPPQDGLHFLPGTAAPEKLLCDFYEKKFNNTELRYHIDKSNVHCLLEKMIEFAGFSTKEAAFEASWACLLEDAPLATEFDAFVEFLVNECRRYSPDL
ncbi:MAG: AAA family ATPase [Pseudomonadota bacterium]